MNAQVEPDKRPFSSYGTHVQTISPGSGSPSYAGEYSVRTRPTERASVSTVAYGPYRPGVFSGG